jgi:hypothetical protein
MPMPPLHGSYRQLERDCGSFLQEHPDYERNVFIMTRFVEGDHLLDKLDEELRRALCRRGLNPVRADDRVVASDDQLWTNVCVYMLCCASGVAVLEDRLKDELNPNVALEYGFMRALDKPVLLLKDKGFRNTRADILGAVHSVFDITDLANTLQPAIGTWATGRKLAITPGASPLEQRTFGIYERLLKIRAASYLRDADRRGEEFGREMHLLGVDISVYEQLLDACGDEAHVSAVAQTRACLLQPELKRDLTALPALTTKFGELSRRMR